jgi:hypothetical protein
MVGAGAAPNSGAVRLTASELAVAYSKTTGRPTTTIASVWMRDHGWTPDTVAMLGELGQHALAHDTGLGRQGRADVALPQYALDAVCSRLLTLAQVLVNQSGTPMAEAFTWLCLAAASPDRDADRSVESLVREGATEGLEDVYGSAMIELRHRLPGLIVPYGWAAGLSHAEMIAQTSGDGLSVDRLRALAVLRGFRFPTVQLAEFEQTLRSVGKVPVQDAGDPVDADTVPARDDRHRLAAGERFDDRGGVAFGGMPRGRGPGPAGNPGAIEGLPYAGAGDPELAGQFTGVGTGEVARDDRFGPGVRLRRLLRALRAS